MTKKNELIWRLKDKPSVEDVTELLEKQVITKEEARNLLFNEADSDTNKLKDLKKQIEFLEDLVKELSRHQALNVYPVVTPTYVTTWVEERHWNPNFIYCSGTMTDVNTSDTIQIYTQQLIG